MRLDRIMAAAPPAPAAWRSPAWPTTTAAVAPGTLFFCVPGFTRDGHDFAPTRSPGAPWRSSSSGRCSLGVPEIRVPSVRAAMAPAAAAFYGDPTARLQTVGVTGTNGKTTTAFLVRALLEADGRQTGLLGTVKSVIGGAERAVERTTPEAIDLQRTFREMLDAGDVACSMEVSSHALELHRADAIHFAAAIFTNLTQDHLDFHGTMEEYFLAKRRLFEPGRRPRTRVVNVDDPYGARLAAELAGAVTFAVEREADLPRRAICSTDLTGSRFTVHGPDGAVRAELAAARAVQRLQRARRVRRRPRRSASRSTSRPRAIETAGHVPGRFRAGRRGSGLRRAGRLRAHPRLARERPARGATAHRRAACTWCSAAAATATAASAR